MAATHLAPVDTWPDVRLTLRPLPWTWKLKPWLYVDDVEGWKGHWSIQWFFVTVEWWGNERLFTELQRVVVPVGTATHNVCDQPRVDP